MDKLLWGDSGLREAADNIVLDSHQVVVTRVDSLPLLRFYESARAVALGAYEDNDFAVRAAYCQAESIPVIRRLTGGGASYLYPEQIAWSLTVQAQESNIEQWLARLCIAMCNGLTNSGYANVYFHKPNDIYVNNRKLGSVYIGMQDNILIANGTLYRSLDISTMLRALRVPKEKLTQDGIRAAGLHFTTLQNRSAVDLSALKESLAQSIAQITGLRVLVRTPWVDSVSHTKLADYDKLSEHNNGSIYSGFLATSGGILHGSMSLDSHLRISSARMGGNVYIRPHHLFKKMESALYGASEDEISQRMENLLYDIHWELLGFTPAHIITLFHRLFERQRIAERLSITASSANSFMVHDPDGAMDAMDIAAQAEAVLVPYCAKPAWCKWRHKDGCSQCGKCDVGQIYHLAGKRGLKVTTVKNFEHLEFILRVLKERDTKCYLGMCCNNFYIKHEDTFRAANIPALLLDIAGANCYDLMQEQAAYSGKFVAESTIDVEVAAKVIDIAHQNNAHNQHADKWVRQ
ncbi:DUF116 domain-containing protein [Acidithiobacillus ferrianus]|uniref:DUF116 domain-containing protein n=2 Tax=Acidithiobacillus ferrianus TaxID=2678518 RepID=A0A845U816_9PROT|nr:DUF116 domain-containing protein [Acidithiobacillus ferrianus]NDU43003.1 DUF116 domain-containing protein [Acidithiobacillus ferrianus]